MAGHATAYVISRAGLFLDDEALIRFVVYLSIFRASPREASAVRYINLSCIATLHDIDQEKPYGREETNNWHYYGRSIRNRS
jgi:hypothetical protein